MHSRGVRRAVPAWAVLATTESKIRNLKPDENRERPRSSSPRASSPVLGPLLGRRRVHTVVADTKVADDGKVEDPGHIQYQPSESERTRDPELAPAIGHARRTDALAPRPERLQVSGTLPDGKPFRVNALKGAAINAGDDKVIDHAKVTRVIDHGEMTDEQIARMKEVQRRPIFRTYETSGAQESNCVHGHAHVARTVFDWNVRPERHARPQDLAEQMAHLRTRDANTGKAAAEGEASSDSPEAKDEG